MNLLILGYILFRDENNFINALLQVESGSGSGFVKVQDPDPAGQKSTDPPGSGSSTLLQAELTVKEAKKLLLIIEAKNQTPCYTRHGGYIWIVHYLECWTCQQCQSSDWNLQLRRWVGNLDSTNMSAMSCLKCEYGANQIYYLMTRCIPDTYKLLPKLKSILISRLRDCWSLSE